MVFTSASPYRLMLLSLNSFTISASDGEVTRLRVAFIFSRLVPSNVKRLLVVASPETRIPAATIASLKRKAVSKAGSGTAPDRSEEHTSELQSLMRISYAVFCLKKKTQINHIQAHTNTYNTTTQM